jgi:hypothetical protein
MLDTSFETTARPLCRLRVGKAPSVEDLDVAFANFESELERAQSFCVLADATITSRLEMSHAKIIADFGERNHARLEAHVMALALVVPSAMVRGALRVAFQLKAPPHPYKIVRTTEDAQAFLNPFLAVCLPPSP